MSESFTVIFDFDGTLADTPKLVVEIYNEHADEFGVLPVKTEQIPYLRTLGYKRGMKALKIRWKILPKLILLMPKEMKKRMNEVYPYPGIVTLLEELKSSGLTVGVLTSNSAELVQTFFKSHNFPKLDFTVTEKTLFSKEKALRKLLKARGLNRDKVIYVGDEPRDIVSCNKAGIKVIGVTWGLGGKEALAITRPDIQVDTVEQLKKAILDEARKLTKL
ncbi:HAD hydrolase-like protein [Candidatus Saccharibacteria bacterium]|nr:HAD hydrolase-like protein [Candidatus Saccharibacteria bacterium]